MLQLIEQSSSLAQLPRPLSTLHALLERCGGVWALTYDEITDHLDELVALLGDVRNGYEPQPSLRWHDGEDELPLEPEPTGPLLTRLPWVEAVEIGDDLIVLTRSKATLLADLTATVWLQLGRPCSVDELVRAAENRHGPHERAEEIVLAAVATLEQEQLVGRGSLA
jgi:hypothetical protein